MVRSSPLGKYHIRATADNRPFESEAAACQGGAALAGPIMRDWPNILEPPVAAPAYWIHEGNMLIYSSLLRSLGGYDPVMRSHEAQDLAIRLEKRGVKPQFDPSLRVLHHHIDVRGKNRNKWEYNAALLSDSQAWNISLADRPLVSLCYLVRFV
jgi:hypothetical protein